MGHMRTVPRRQGLPDDGAVQRCSPRAAKCALFGLLQVGGVAIAGGATVRQIAVATALGCIGGVVAPKA